LWWKLRSREYALFFVPWLIVLVIPQLRLLLITQVVGSSVTGNPYPWTAALEGADREKPGAEAFSTRRLARLYPHDPRVLACALDENPQPQARAAGFDRLINGFPRENWLIARRLRATVVISPRQPLQFSNMLDYPFGYEEAYYPENVSSLYNEDLNADSVVTVNTMPVIPPTGRAAKRPVTISPELIKAIQVARLGRQREPQNAFFDWMLAAYLFAAYHDREALAVLHEGAQKPYYDAHTSDIARQDIAVFSLVRPLLFEEKSNLFMRRLGDFDQRAALYAVAAAGDAETRRDHRRALDIYDDLMRFVRKMRGGGALRLWAGNWLARLVWNGTTRSLTPAERGQVYNSIDTVGTESRILVHKFALYARQHNRADLATSALQYYHAFNAAVPTGSDYGVWSKRVEWHRDVPGADILLATVDIGISCIFLLPLLLCLRALMFPLAWPFRLRSGPLLIRDALTSGAFYALGMLSAITGALWYASHHVQHAQWDTPAGFVAVVILYLPLSLMLNAMGVAAITTWRHRKLVYARGPVERGYAGVHVPPNLLAPTITVACWAVLTVTAACWGAALIAALKPQQVWLISLLSWAVIRGLPPTLSIDAGVAMGLGCFLTLLSYIVWLIRWRWFAPVRLRPVAHYAVNWHRLSLGTWAIVISLTYLLLAVGSLPLRHAVDARFDRYLQQDSRHSAGR
jgi:hypothetical protein